MMTMAVAACQSATSPDPGPGEHVESIKASPDTLAATGVVSWEMFRDAVQTTVIGVDAQGRTALREQITEGVVNGQKVLDIAISQPAQRSYRITDDGMLTNVTGAEDPRLTALLGHFEADAKAPSDSDAEYGPCLSCATNTTACAASTAACVTTCPTTVVGCITCAAAATTCFAAGYYCACCYDGGTNC